MQFLKRSRIFSGEKGCCRIARVFESGVNFIESGRHGTLRTPRIRITHIQECYHERADGRGLCFGQSVNPGNEPKNPAQLSVHIARSVISRHPSRSALRAYETAAASGAMAAVSWRQASRLSAPLGA